MDSTEGRTALRTVAWRELFPWLNLFTAAKLAADYRALLLAAVAIALTSAGWRVIGGAFTAANDSQLQSLVQSNRGWPWLPADVAARLTPQEAEFLRQLRLDANRLPTPTPMVVPQMAWPLNHLTSAADGARQVFAPLMGAFDRGVTAGSFLYLALCSAWSLVVWSACGGAITRLAAVGLARESQLSWDQLFVFGRTRWLSYLCAPLYPILGLLALSAPVALLGLLLRFEVGIVVAGLLWFLALAAGAVMAVLFLGVVFGLPLMWASISTEGTDAFGALGRAFPYVLQRPLHYFMYAVIALLVGSVAWTFAILFASVIVDLTAWAASWGAGNERVAAVLSPQPAGFGSIGSSGIWLVQFWTGLATLFGLAYGSSYFWTAGSAIYLLLRKDVDSSELDEVYLPEEDDVHGMPPIVVDESGVAMAADVARPRMNEGPEG